MSINMYRFDGVGYCPNCKKFKALKIIKKKGILVNGLIQSKDLEEYNIMCLNHGMTELLTQEEYELLKEILCNTLKKF